MRTIVIDDEASARGMLREILEHQSQIEVIDEAKNGVEAIEKVNQLKPDLIFLDIQMPLLSGFELLPYLKEKPLIVFCTAYDQYALEAFEAQAVDYLLKPVEEERLLKSLEKLKTHWEKVKKLDFFVQPKSGLKKIVCQVNGVSHIVWMHDVARFQKEGRYTAVLTSNGTTYLSDLTIDYLAEKVPEPQFFRINRSIILAKSAVASFKSGASGLLDVETAQGETLSVSRARVANFKSWVKA